MEKRREVQVFVDKSVVMPLHQLVILSPPTKMEKTRNETWNMISSQMTIFEIYILMTLVQQLEEEAAALELKLEAVNAAASRAI